MQQHLWGLSSGGDERFPAQLGDGATLLRHYLDVTTQRALASQCQALLDGPAGGYIPTVRGGGQMRVRMLCLGRHWNPQTYRYESTRADHDDAPVGRVPEDWIDLASRIASEAGFSCRHDICLVNAYGTDGRMGLHQDKDESAESIAAGDPIVSISIGDTARFLFGGLRRRDPVASILLESGDALLFGGASRLRYHGVSRIIPGTAPEALAMTGRINLTFRKY